MSVQFEELESLGKAATEFHWYEFVRGRWAREGAEPGAEGLLIRKALKSSWVEDGRRPRYYEMILDGAALDVFRNLLQGRVA